MKKFVCLLMVATLALTLSIAVFARYEVCPVCNGRMTEKVTEKVIGTVTCPISGDPDMQDDEVRVTTTLTCTACGNIETSFYIYTDCHH